ncbi:MAG: polysaccharide deacetylase family protein [Patescibacteria group bacterium]
MRSIVLQNAITDTKIRFTLLVFVLAAIIIVGSFYLVGYLNFTIQKQLLFATSLRYRAEYIAQQQGIGFLAAVGAAFEPKALLNIGQRERAQGVPVLTYHSILANKDDEKAETAASEFEGGNVSLEHFKEQMFRLKSEGWQTVSYADFEAFVRGEKELPAKSFLLTFDDGAKNSFYPVEPLLEALGFSAVAFILPEHSLGDRSSYYLNKNELELMLSTGNWTLESHGQDIHVSLPTDASGVVKDNALSNRMWIPLFGRLETHEEYAARIKNDLALAKRNLEEAFNIAVTGFAFPFGDYGQNASNDAQGQATVLDATKESYSLAFYQNWNKGNFSFNYPNPNALLVKRIPVKPDWSGEKLMAVLNAAYPKPLPYESVPREDGGWESDWGKMEIKNGVMHLKASTSTTGAIAVLDGTYTWENYQVDIPLQWESGYVMVLFDLQSEQIGRACVFADDGTVQLQSRAQNDILILRETKVEQVKPGEHTIGAVSKGTTTACVFDGEYVIDATLSPASGGVGVEVWGGEPGVAEAFIKNISAKKK